MGSSGMLFARNVEFEATFPDLGKNELARNRHGERLDMLRPDPQLISRELFTRSSNPDHNCKADFTPDVYPNEAQPSGTNCDYVTELQPELAGTTPSRGSRAPERSPTGRSSPKTLTRPLR